jgi:large subunit ribosomal protein L13
MRSYAPKRGDRDPRWYLVDAEGQPLGRLASVIASHLRGKHRPDFAPNFDHGDHVVVVNAAHVLLTGNKKEDKLYQSHSGYPGGLKEIAAGKLLETRPERVIEAAVAGMLPKNSLGRKCRANLKVYAGPDHPHDAQMPVPLSVDMRRRTRTAVAEGAQGPGR